MPSCRMLPHGGYALLIATMSSIAWWASLFQDGCDYAKVTGDLVDEMAETAGVPYLEMGFSAYREPDLIVNGKTGNQRWEVDYSGQCKQYPIGIGSDDSKWKAARIFAFIALVVGGGGTLFVWCSTCFEFSVGTWRFAGLELFLASFFQSLAFIWFKNTTVCQMQGTTCSLFWGSRADILASTFWLISSMLLLARYPLPQVQVTNDPNSTSGMEGKEGNTTTKDTQRSTMGKSINNIEVAEEPTVAQHPNAEVI